MIYKLFMLKIFNIFDFNLDSSNNNHLDIIFLNIFIFCNIYIYIYIYISIMYHVILFLK